MNELASRMEGEVLVLAFNRPTKANALNEAMQDALVAALGRPDPAAKAIVLAAEGERVWSAGADLKEFADLDRALVSQKRRALLKRTLLAVANCRLPLVAAVHGKCLGAGAMIALLADELVMAKGAELGLPEIHHGMPTPVGYAIVAARGGMPIARRMVQDGDPVGTELADFTCEREALPGKALERARKLAHGGAAFGVNKAYINAPLATAIEDAFAAADRADRAG